MKENKGKKRFGISIPGRIAEELDKLVGVSGGDRSTIVAKALEEYLHEEYHASGEHECSGIIVIFNKAVIDEPLLSSYSRIIKSTIGVKLSKGYVTVLFVEGPYGEIQSLREQLIRLYEGRIATRYIPVYCGRGTQ